LVPPQVVLFCKHPATKQFDLSHCHFGLVGAAPVSAELSEQFKRALPNIHFGQAYGLLFSLEMLLIGFPYPLHT
jgi:acyl-CoA synthetase (AMP-forming)/AMP-acid ligase II